MKKTRTQIAGRILSLVLSALIVCSCMPVWPAYADDQEEQKKVETILEESESQAPVDEDDPLTAEELKAEEPKDEAKSGDEVNSNALDKNASPEDIVKSMSTEQKVAQCLMMAFRYWSDGEGGSKDMTTLDSDVAEIIAKYQFGAVVLFANNIKETEGALALTKDMQAAAESGGGLPMLIATDQEGGIVYRLGSGTALPGNMALAATGDAANASLAGEIIGRELSSVGINTTLAPVLDVNNNANNPVIGTRSFSDDADTVVSFGTEYIKGLKEYDTIGCAKHFPGHGDTNTDSHYGLPTVDKSKDELYANELKSFKAAIDQGIDMIMTAHILYPQVDNSTVVSEKTGKAESRPATMSHVILTDILRGEMGFEGVVVTDAMDMNGISDYFTGEQAALEAIKAGADIICMPVWKYNGEGKRTYVTEKDEMTEKLDSLITYISDAAEKDSAVMDRLNEAATRVITLKKNRGILSYNADNYTAEKALAAVGSDENRKLEREISAKAVTVIRNDDDILPYKATEDTKVLMLCPYKNERAQMVMGFNRAKKAGKVPSDAKVSVYNFSKDDYKIEGKLKEEIDKATLVVINSEVSDADDMSYGYYTSVGVKNVTEYCRKAGIKSIVMSVDKPYDAQLYPAADAIVVTYGCKGSSMELTDEVMKELLAGNITEDRNACGPNIIAGVEVIFGVFEASGVLPVNIPVFDSKTGNFTDEIVYGRGYNINYNLSKATLSINKNKYAYTGKNQIPQLTVTDSSGTELIKGTDYTVQGGRKAVGAGNVTIKGAGRYAGTMKASFAVVPAKASIKKTSRGKRSIKLIMSTLPASKGGSKYQVAYRVKGSKKWHYKTITSKTVTIKRLKRGKRYIVKVRAIKTVNGKKYNGAWSKTKTTGKVL